MIHSVVLCICSRVNLHFVVESATDGDDSMPSNIAIGRLSDALCRRLLDPPEGLFDEHSLWLVCGPAGFNAAARG